MKLYEIADSYRTAFDEMDAMDDLPKEVIDGTLEAIEAEFDDKAEAGRSIHKGKARSD